MKTQPAYAKSMEGRIRRHENVQGSFKANDNTVMPSTVCAHCGWYTPDFHTVITDI